MCSPQGYESSGTWTGIPQWSAILLVFLDLLLIVHSSFYVLPLYALIQPLGNHCPKVCVLPLQLPCTILCGWQAECAAEGPLGLGEMVPRGLFCFTPCSQFVVMPLLLAVAPHLHLDGHLAVGACAS